MRAYPTTTPFELFLAMASMGTLLQHAYTCATQRRWGFLALGVLLWPVGIINGLGSWLGFW
jgi:hypothetical protein